MPSNSAKNSGDHNVTIKRVVILVYPGVTLLDAAGPAQVFSSANNVEIVENAPFYSVVLASPAGGMIMTDSSVELKTVSLRQASSKPIDTLIAAGGIGVFDVARERELLFVSSPFSQAAVDLLRRVGVDVWKVASGEVADARLLGALLGDERPILLSSGMSPWSELDRAVADLRAGGNPFALLQCSSRYPCPPKSIGLNVLGELRERYDAPVGLSDHSGTIFPGLAAVTLGASVVEVHVTMHRACFGPDVASSLTLEELAELVRGVRFIEKMMRSPVDKDQMAEELAPMRALFTKSLVASRDLEAGTVLAEADLVVKKPGSGLPGERLPALVGRRLVRALKRDDLLAEEDVEL